MHFVSFLCRVCMSGDVKCQEDLVLNAGGCLWQSGRGEGGCTKILRLMNAPVDERVGCWNVLKKQYTEVECVGVKITKLSILCYDSICLMYGCWWHICHCSLSAILRKKIGKPKEENWKSKWI
jgi:hypothetical protein